MPPANFSAKAALRYFPIQIALGAFLVYLATLAHGVTAGSLDLTAKVAGWDRQPMVGLPVYWLVTLPVRLLPSAWVPLALNVFSALCAAAVLGVLVRSLELLPRPFVPAQGWLRFLPGLLAAAVCGGEFNFWQEAVSGGAETLDVLMFAIPFWCLLEFRANGRWPWLRAAVFIWGAGMAQNWMMLLALPLFAFGIFLLRPLDFLRPRYLLALAGWGLAGFSVYALLPLWNGLAPGAPLGFGEAWLVSLRQTKQVFSMVYHQFWAWQKLMGLAVSVFYLMPVLACMVKLPDEDMANKSPLDQLQIWLFRGLRAGLLLLCLWLALDPAVGPRGILRHQMKLGLPLLSFDFLCALAAGHLAGALVSVARKKNRGNPFLRLGGSAALALERGMPAMVTAVLLATGALLAARSLPVILANNRSPLAAFGELAVRSLPPGGGILLGDFSDKLAVFQAAQARHPAAQNWLPADTALLPLRQYRERLAKLHPADWLLSPTNRHDLTGGQTLQLVAGLVRSNRVFYLHPSFGPFFEFSYLDPAGSLFEMKLYATNTVWQPALPPAAVAQNEKFWDENAPLIGSLQSAGVLAKPSWLEQKLHLDPARSQPPAELREWLSVSLDAWGVVLQRQNELAAARHRFEQAAALNPNNWVASANLFCNTNLAAGQPVSMSQAPNLAGQFRNLQQLALSAARLGPGDEPTICYLVAGAFEQVGLPRQTLQQLSRAAALSPQTMAPRLALASLALRCRQADLAAQNIGVLENEIKKLPEPGRFGLSVALLRAELCLLQTNLAGARAVYQRLLRENPGDTDLWNRVLQTYASVGAYADADSVATDLLAQNPDDVLVLLAKSGTLLRTGRAAEAIPLLQRILARTNSVPARLNLAVAEEQAGHYEAARDEFLSLLKVGANPAAVSLGLAEVSLRLRDTNQALSYYSACLAGAEPDSALSQEVRTRRDALKGVPAKSP